MNAKRKKDGGAALPERVLEAGANTAGAVSGAVLGAAMGGAEGAALGAVAGQFVHAAAATISHLLLPQRQRTRIEEVVRLATTAIADLKAEGLEPRTDGFFDSRNMEESPAEEIAEGVLQVARDAYEQKKVPLLATFLARIAFHSEIAPEQANFLVRTIDQLTYEQIGLLALLPHSAEFGVTETPFNVLGPLSALNGGDRISLQLELWDLYRRGFVQAPGGGMWLNLTEFGPGRVQVVGAGANLYVLMGLEDFDRDELRRLTARLNWIPES